MSTMVKKIALTEQRQQPEGPALNVNYLGLVGNLEVQCSVRIGTIQLSIAELQQLKVGQVLHLAQKTNEPVDIVLNDRVIGRGELMSYEDQFAIQITEIVS